MEIKSENAPDTQAPHSVTAMQSSSRTVSKRDVVTNCDHLASLKFSKALPLAFTEHGAIHAANVLNSAQAVDMGLYVARAIVRLREMIVSNSELASRLNELESKVDLTSVRHDTFAHST